tara:strand:+ start:289 stop:576 length:288 start_codon:yes stop_codon:yes gene_type:complete
MLILIFSSYLVADYYFKKGLSIEATLTKCSLINGIIVIFFGLAKYAMSKDQQLDTPLGSIIFSSLVTLAISLLFCFLFYKWKLKNAAKPENKIDE